jgi:hypothetical protein
MKAGCRVALTILIISAVSTANAAVGGVCPTIQRAASTGQVATIVELYTSEGCDSCPPADRWFSTLKNRRDVVPLAFHVDYWDYIGWKDRFAQPAFSDRQRKAVARQGSRVTYTPQVMLDGRDTRPPLLATFGSSFDSSVQAISKRIASTSLVLNATRKGDSLGLEISAKTSIPAEWRNAELQVAVTESELTSRVTAGENRGSTLTHDHVVRLMLPPVPLAQGIDIGNREIGNISIPLDAGWNRERLALVAFIQNRENGQILQAVSLSVCN